MDTFSGDITWDDETHGQFPLCVIDGKKMSWHELGRLVMTYEGFQFKLCIHEEDEDITHNEPIKLHHV